MKVGQPHSSAEKRATLSPAHRTASTVKQSTGDWKIRSFVEVKRNRKVQLNRLEANWDKLLAVITYIVSGSAAYDLFTAASAGPDIKLSSFFSSRCIFGCAVCNRRVSRVLAEEQNEVNTR